MDYIAFFSHGEQGSGGKLILDARNNKDAIAEVRAFVEAGWRNETTAGVEMSNGSYYQAWNEHGIAKGRISNG